MNVCCGKVFGCKVIIPLMTTFPDTTTINGSKGVESPADFVEYHIAHWLWLYIAPGLLIVGLTGKLIT